MFEVGDLVTVDSEALRLHVHENVYKQWKTCELGIVVDVEGYKNQAVLLVKVHFQSLGSAYWLHSYEVIPINPRMFEAR
tara:strand:+ start:1123 stop:1359 length:237 start_codon:yes stop_codon:yes gene_type:complete